MSNTNTKIFSEAIAEAKSIRETAMVNAKLALEEAFAPRMQEMMSSKLAAMAEDDEEMEENFADKKDSMEEISLEELLAELEALEEGETEEVYEEEQIDESKLAEEAEDDDTVGEITVDDLKDVIRDVFADLMGGSEEEEAGEEEEMTGEEEAGEEEELNLEEILAELESLNESEELDEEFGGPGTISDDNLAIKAINDLADKIAKATGKTVAVVKAKLMSLVKEEQELDEEFGGPGTISDDNLAIKAINDLADKVAKATGKTVAVVKAKLMSLMNEEQELSELEEAMSTISTLRSELNEVNLLNAKLLYVNKLFKSKNLTEAQKVKVINAFDRAETVKETKNIFETLQESLNVTPAKNSIKESLSYASKPVGVTDRKPIVENNDFILRMQKLAGII
jgi:TfoX/Sxy family transcriptional regulator of competence genes